MNNNKYHIQYDFVLLVLLSYPIRVSRRVDPKTPEIGIAGLKHLTDLTVLWVLDRSGRFEGEIIQILRQNLFSERWRLSACIRGSVAVKLSLRNELIY